MHNFRVIERTIELSKSRKCNEPQGIHPTAVGALLFFQFFFAMRHESSIPTLLLKISKCFCPKMPKISKCWVISPPCPSPSAPPSPILHPRSSIPDPPSPILHPRSLKKTSRFFHAFCEKCCIFAFPILKVCTPTLSQSYI